MLNVAVVMGQTGSWPGTPPTAGDVAVTGFTLAVDRSTLKSGTEAPDRFHRYLVAWRWHGISYANFRKGQMMAVHGSIQTHLYRQGRQQAQGF